MLSRAKRQRTSDKASKTAPDPLPPSPPIARLPQELQDLVIDVILQQYDSAAELEKQVKLRCLGPPPIGKRRGITQARRRKDTTLLGLAQISHALRPRALRYLWKTLRIETVEEIDLVHSLLTSEGGAQAYGRHVERVEFAWIFGSDSPRDRHALQLYHRKVQPRASLVDCAFAERTSKFAAASEFRMDLKSSWYTNTNGPDGKGEIAGIKAPSDLDRALVQIFTHLCHIDTIMWDSSALRLSSSVASAITSATGGVLKNFGFFLRVKPRGRNNPKVQDTGVPVSYVPCLHASLQHLYIHDGHQYAEDHLLTERFLVVDDAKPFGLRPLMNAAGGRFEAPSAQWIVQTCIDGALNGLKKVTLSTDTLLRKRELWPLWIFLNVEVSDYRFRYSWTRVYVEGNTDRGSIFAGSLKTVRDAIRTYSGAKEGDWLEMVLQLIVEDLTAEQVALQRQIAALNEELDDIMDDLFAPLRLTYRQDVLADAKHVCATLLADAQLRRRVAKCWEENAFKIEGRGE